MAEAEQVLSIGRAFAEGLREALSDTLHGVYLYGAATFPDGAPTGDIDFHVILAGTLSASEREAIERLHDAVAERYPPLGRELDGYYLLLDDARRPTPPRSQMWDGATDTAWALHRAHILAGRCVVLHGPDPNEVYPPVDWPELEAALYSERDYIKEHLAQYPDYCILNLCRLMYSFETRDVVISKARAGEWARDVLPEWRQAIELARKSYAGQATPQDREHMIDLAGRLFPAACARIEKVCREKPGPSE